MKTYSFILISLCFLVIAIRPGTDRIITGRVTDESGNPLNAAVHYGKFYEITDQSGNYKIAVSPKTEFLLFSAPGHESRKVIIGNKTVINVKLKIANAPVKPHYLPFKGSTGMSEVIIQSGGTMPISSPQAIYNSTQQMGLNKSSAMMGNKLSGVSIGGYFPQGYNTEGYNHISENEFRRVTDEPLSTFSLDIDGASYSNVRRFINNNQLPPEGAVRVEEMINYFRYQYPQPTGNTPFSITTELSDCPWNPQNKLLLIGLQGKKIPVENLPSSNLVFLIDVSGSMDMPDKLPLVKESLKMLADQLREKDKISIVTYAGRAGLRLPSTSGSNKEKIKSAIDALYAEGYTAGGAGIKLAYKIAQENLMKEGNNRVILCTDGDFNVGVSSEDGLVRLIEGERDKGIFLSVLGYGMGNYQDGKMQMLADKGNGNHFYIDGLNEAKKVLVNEFGGTLFTIAKDVKLQVEFNPALVAGYRLVGYENRILNKEDFNDDKKDAGELGSDHTMTALYEIIPAGINSPYLKNVDPLKYQSNHQEVKNSLKDEWATIKFRYKEPDGNVSRLIVHPVKNSGRDWKNASENFRFAASVAEFGMLLSNSKFKGTGTYNDVIRMAESVIGEDTEGYRKEFIGLVKKASGMKANDQDGSENSNELTGMYR